MRVGLTGGIASGKTTVGRMFVELGCRLIDSDEIAHSLFEPGEDVHRRVAQTFGPAVVAADSRIDRQALGEIVFRDAEKRQILNEIVHPAVIARQREFMESVEREDAQGIAIVDAALMLETGTYKNYDKVIVVVCPADMQVGRLMKRNGLSETQARARVAAQMPAAEKIKFADYVIDTNGAIEETRAQVRSVYDALRRSQGKS